MNRIEVYSKLAEKFEQNALLSHVGIDAEAFAENLVDGLKTVPNSVLEKSDNSIIDPEIDPENRVVTSVEALLRLTD